MYLRVVVYDESWSSNLLYEAAPKKNVETWTWQEHCTNLRREGTKASLCKNTSMWSWGEVDSALQLLSGMEGRYDLHKV